MENNLSSWPWNSSRGESSLLRKLWLHLWGSRDSIGGGRAAPRRGGLEWEQAVREGERQLGSGRDGQTTPRSPWCAPLTAGQPEEGPLTLRSCRQRAWARGPSEPQESSGNRIRRRALSSSGSGLGCKTWVSQDREAGYTSQHPAGGPGRGHLPVGRQ